MNLDQLISDFIKSQVVRLATGTFGIPGVAAQVIYDFVAGIVDDELARSGYYLLVRFALERVQVDPETGDIGFSAASAADLQDFFDRHVYNNPNTVEVIGSEVSLLWSHHFGEEPTQRIDGKAISQLAAEDLAKRSDGKIRFIGGTSAGYLFDALLSPTSLARSLLVGPLTRDEVTSFWDDLSRFYVEETTGPMITLTPLSSATTVFGRIEVPAIGENEAIDEINGADRGEIGFNLFSSSEAARSAYLMALFNGNFAGDLIASTSR